LACAVIRQLMRDRSPSVEVQHVPGDQAGRPSEPDSRICRIERVACSHAYPLIGMFTANIEGRLEAATIINSASSFVSPATSR
jgi:hypothetical protein